jgi:DNA-binding CsgD family transcriptional regulator
MTDHDSAYRPFLDSALALSKMKTPAAVLNALHKASTALAELSVLVACRLPLNFRDLSAAKKGVNVFVHWSVPHGWFDEYRQISVIRQDIALIFSELGLAPYTLSETRKQLDPIGVDQWSYELATKYRMRDVFLCPVGSRWLVGFWSKKVLGEKFDQRTRAILFTGAGLAAIRLEELVFPEASRLGQHVMLSPRELAVIRHASVGERQRDIAISLSLGEETVRSHLKKAQEKLGARTSTHAVAEAIRRRLIP